MELSTELPNFLIPGAAKAGTTALYDLLKQHPQVYLPFRKEPMFFSHEDNYQRGLEWYIRIYFRAAARYPLRGEASPHYLYWSEKVAPRLRQVYARKAVRFIVIFRDPVARAYSWYWNMVKEGLEELPFESALEAEQRRLQDHQEELQHTGAMTYGYFKGSCYATLMQPFLDLFPPENFLFLLQEDLTQAFQSTTDRLLDFLGLDTNISLRPVSSNPAVVPRSLQLQRWLRRQSNFRERLTGLFPLRFRHTLKAGILQANARPVRYPKLDPILEAGLRHRLEPEVLRLEKMIDRDLSQWLPN